MVIVNLIGGLGNQMFQYAFGRYLSYVTGKDLYLNVDIYKNGLSNRNYDLDIFILSKHTLCVNQDLNNMIEESESLWYQISEKFFHYDLDLINDLESKILNQPNFQNVNLIISGYWQSFKYFNTISSLIMKDFTFVNPVFGKWKILLEEIELSESIMINVRRGDYLQKMEYHGVVSIKYINEAIEIMKEKLENPKFFLFSDDINWCKEHFQDYQNLYIIDEQYYDNKYQYYLQLMCACKHFIISNSTFSWWSVILSKNKDNIVIAPSSWFSTDSLDPKDIYLESWIKI